MASSYTYRWGGDYAVVLGAHSSPEGTGVLAKPGKEFTTTEPFDHPDAIPQDGSKKPKSEVAAPESTDLVAEETAK